MTGFAATSRGEEPFGPTKLTTADAVSAVGSTVEAGGSCRGSALPAEHWRRTAPEVRHQQQQIGCVGGDDAVLEAHCERDDVCVDDVGRPRPQEHPAYHLDIDEGEVVYLDGAEEPGKSGLPATVSPHLRHNRSRRAQHRALLQRGGEKGLGCSLASVDRYEHPGVEDHEAK